jgi:hypothetical protein
MTRTAMLLAALAAPGCMAVADPVEGEPTALVFRTMKMERAVRGVSLGFDLDGAVTDAGDALGCNQDDRVHPDGTQGIDNQIAELLPLLDAVAEGTLDAFLQNAIDEGRLLLMPEVRLRGADVELRMLRGTDAPLLGSDGHLLDHQTFALHPEKGLLGSDPSVTVEGDLFAGGRLEAGPFDVDFLMLVFDILYEIRLLDARLAIEVDEEGRGRGTLSGAVSLDELRNVAAVAGERGGLDILGLFGTLLEDLADLRRDRSGRCQAMSLVTSFETVPAYVRR